jgi:hypothetical protein
VKALKTLALWFASFVRPVAVPVWIAPKSYRKRFAHVMRFGAIAMVPLVMGAAFTALEYTFPLVAAGTDVQVEIGVVPEAESQQQWQVTKIALIAPSLLTGATATAVTFQFGYSRAGAAIVPIGTFTTVTGAGGNLAANGEVNVAILAAGLSLLAGDVITLVTTHVSTGTAIPNGTIARVELA